MSVESSSESGIRRVTRDDDGELRSCPVCAASWPEWRNRRRDGDNPLVQHLFECHGPADFGLQERGQR